MQTATDDEQGSKSMSSINAVNNESDSGSFLEINVHITFCEKKNDNML